MPSTCAPTSWSFLILSQNLERIGFEKKSSTIAEGLLPPAKPLDAPAACRSSCPSDFLFEIALSAASTLLRASCFAGKNALSIALSLASCLSCTSMCCCSSLWRTFDSVVMDCTGLR